MDRQARHDLEEAIRTVGVADDDARLYFDEIGPAVYRLDAQPVTVVACGSCRHLGLVPSIPKKPELVWKCPGCGRGWALQPPAAVWVEGSRPQLVRPGN